MFMLSVTTRFTESMDNTYAVMHNPHNKDKGESAKSSEQEQPPPIPPKLYENIFDDPIIAEHNGDVAKSSEEEELPPPLPPKLYENVFDDPAGSAEHSNGVKNDHDVERGATQTDQAASQAQLQGWCLNKIRLWCTHIILDNLGIVP